VRRGAHLALAFAALIVTIAPAVAGPWRPVNDVSARPLASFRVGFPNETRFGALEWLGGLQISDAAGAIGGLSDLYTWNQGRSLLSLSDDGNWFTADIVSDDDGRPRSLTAAAVADLIPANAKARDKDDVDSEGLAVRRRGDRFEAAVSFEERHRIELFSSALDPRDIALKAGRPLPSPPPELKTLRWSKGLEALAATPPGHILGDALIGIAEWPRRGEDDMPGFIIGGARPGLFHVKRRDDFDATSAAFLPGGDLLLLERRFSLLTGPGMRIRRIKAADIVPGAIVDGAVLISANITQAIDNMEGLAVDTAPDGSTILTVISDDNRSLMQRTLLLRFKLLDAAP
jgi:hypothetical protein